MSGNVLKYKGYSAVIEYSAEDQVLHGKIEGIRDLVDFCSESATEIEKEFHAAVDSYLAFCAEIGKEPDREYSGTFNVRINPALHKQIAIRAVHEGWSLNTAVENAIECYLKQEEQESHPIIGPGISIRSKEDEAFNRSLGTLTVLSGGKDPFRWADKNRRSGVQVDERAC